MSDIAVGSVGDPNGGQPGETTPGGPGSSRRVFVGRQAESAILDRVWSDTSDGPCSLVIVHGNAGFGKSLLINAFVGRIAPPVLLRVACEPDESTLAYAALGQLLSGDPAWRTKVLRDTVGDEGDADPLATGSRLLEMFEALGEDGLVVTIDDVAWADPSSVRALVFALRRLRGGRVLVVFTCRDESLDTLPASLQRMLHDLARWVPLGGFGPVEVAELATALGLKTLSSPAADRVVSHSAGSPLHARALLDDLSTEQLEGDPDWPLPAPIAFSDLVRARLTACGPQGTSLVETAAVSGDGPSARLLAEISGIADVTVALEEAASAGLIRLPLADGQIRLDHPLVRSTIYHDIPPSRLAELHQQIADRWGPSNAVAGLRHRVAATPGLDPILAAEVAAGADADAAQGSLAIAAEGFKLAVGLCPPGGIEAGRYLMRMVDCLALGGEEWTIGAARATIEAYPITSLRNYCLARMRAAAGDFEVTQVLLDDAWTLAQGDEVADSELVARIAMELARIALNLGHGADAARWAQRALALLPEGDAEGSDVMIIQLIAMGIQGQSREVLALFKDLPETIPNPTLVELDAMVGRGVFSLWNEDVDQAVVDLVAAERATRGSGPGCPRHRPRTSEQFASAFVVDVAYRVGDWDLAIAEAEAALAIRRDLGQLRALPLLHAAVAYPHAARGDLTIAAEHVAIAEASVGDVPTRLWTCVAAARLAAASREPGGIISALEPLVAMADLDGVREPGVQPWQCLYAEALIATGSLKEAAAVLDDAEERAVRRDLSVHVLEVQRVRAVMSEATGQIEQGVAILTQALLRRESILNRPFEAAQFDLVHGRLLRRAGRRRDAASTLRRANLAFSELRAAPWTLESKEELARCGLKPRARRNGNTLTLSPTEHIVARLVAIGSTNREIANQLAISVKTVEYHLGNTYAKLGIRSRGQLAARMPKPTQDARLSMLGPSVPR